MSSDLHGLRALASDGLGIVYGVDGGLPADVAAGPDLQPVLDDVVGSHRALRIVMPAGLTEVPRILAALELLQGLSRAAPVIGDDGGTP